MAGSRASCAKGADGLLKRQASKHLEMPCSSPGFPILSVDKPGWWWVVHTCNAAEVVGTWCCANCAAPLNHATLPISGNDIYKLDPPVKEETASCLQF